MILNKKIFLTGGKGFIGKNLKKFYSTNNSIIEYNRDKSIIQELKDSNPDIIINCAAEIYDPLKMFNSNVVLVKDILDYCKKSSIEHFIHFGSSSEYGEKKDPMSESDILTPKDIYGATKSSSSLICQGYAHYYDIPVTVIRPFSVYGIFEKPHRLFPRLINHFLFNKDLTIYQGYHDFIYIKDLIRGVEKVIKSDKSISKGDIVNLGTGKQYSNFKILEIFEEILSIKSKAKKVNKFAKKFETGNWKCDTSYASNKYNFYPKYSIQEGIKNLITYYEN